MAKTQCSTGLRLNIGAAKVCICSRVICGSGPTMENNLPVPFRIHCSDCLFKNTIVDFTDICKNTGAIHTFMVCERSGAFNTLEKPIKFINVEFDGTSTILMSYLSVGEPEMGLRVVPIFRTRNPSYTITDLSWVTEGVAEKDLPEGFTYGQQSHVLNFGFPR